MKRTAKHLVSLLLAAALGWAGMSVWLRRSVSAVWKDTPLATRAPYPAPVALGAQSRLERFAAKRDVVGLAAWLNEVANETSVDRLRAAVDAARSLPSGWAIFATRVALERLADVDPEAALDFALLRLGNGTPGWNALANLLRLRAGADPGQVRPFLTAAATQLCLGHGGVEALAKLRPDECLDVIERLHLPPGDPGVAECLRGAAEAHPARALALMDGDDDARNRVIRRWMEGDPEAALVWLRTNAGHPGAIAATEMAALIDSAVREQRIEGIIAAEGGRTRILRALAAKDAALTAKALAALSEDERATLVRDLADNEMLPEHPQQALLWLETLPPDLRPSYIPMGWPVPTEALPRWLALGTESWTVHGQVAGLVQARPETARDWFDSLPPAAQSGALSGVVDGLATVDPQQAADILSTQPRGQRWSAAVTSLAEKWGAYDPTGVAAWIGTLPPHTAREARRAAGLPR